MPTNAVPAVVARSVPGGHGWQWIVDAWTLTAGYRALFVGLVAALVVLAGVVDAIPLVGSLAGALLALALTAGLVIGFDALRRGEPLKLDHLFAGFDRKRPKLVALAVIFAVANFIVATLGDVIAGPGGVDALFDMLLGVLLGGAAPDPVLVRAVMLRSLLGMLVILALSIPLYMAVWFAIPLVTLRELDIMPAMKASFSACVKNMHPFIVWSVPPLLVTIVLLVPFAVAISARSLLLGLLSALLLLLDLLLLVALTFASIYSSYRDVFALGE
jgi:hypothetical protein